MKKDEGGLIRGTKNEDRLGQGGIVGTSLKILPETTNTRDRLPLVRSP